MKNEVFIFFCSPKFHRSRDILADLLENITVCIKTK